MAGVHTNRGAKRARLARQELGLDPAQPVPCLLTCVEERAGIPVAVWCMGDVHLAGSFHRQGERQVIFVNGEQALVRQRFTLAHELGHAWIGHESTGDVERFDELSGRDPLEVEANAFAAELLVPRGAVQERFCGSARPTLEDLLAVAVEFGVSVEVVLYRLRTCGVVELDWYERLHGEVKERLHRDLAHDAPALQDRLADLELPYLSPAIAGSRLADRLRAGA